MIHIFKLIISAILIFLFVNNSFGQKMQKFICKNNVKCNGVEFSINIPTEYTPFDGDRPHIVKKFILQEEHFTTSIVLYIRKFPHEPDSEEIENILSIENIYNLYNVSKLIEYDENANIDNQKCLTATIYNEAKVYTNELYNIINLNLFIWKDNLIQVNFFITSKHDNYNQLLNYYKSNRVLFNNIMTSFVLTSKWKDN